VTTRCDDLDPFFDGELSGDRGQAFRVHLASCKRCQAVLHGRMLEAMVVEPAPACAYAASDSARMLPDPSGRRRSRRWTVLVGAVAASVALVYGPEHREPREATPAIAVLAPSAPARAILALADVRLAANRPFDVRFSTVELDRHRPAAVFRAADEPDSESIPRATLARLEDQGQLDALVAAHALRGELRSAMEVSRNLPGTAASLSDRAALELLRYRDARQAIPPAAQQQAAEQAISLATAALQLDPRRTQAMVRRSRWRPPRCSWTRAARRRCGTRRSRSGGSGSRSPPRRRSTRSPQRPSLAGPPRPRTARSACATTTAPRLTTGSTSRPVPRR
jgi:hypothetical protein